MSFNFLDQYKDYSTIDLLKIAKRPDEHQPAAFEAATQLLKGRQILASETEEADRFYKEVVKAKQFKNDQINFYKEKATDFFEPVLKPGTEVKPGKWINILLLIIGLQYLWVFYNTISYFIHFLRCTVCFFDISFFWGFISLLYVPVIFFLLFKKRRWGWILLFADNFFSVLSLLGQSFIYFNDRNIHGDNEASFFLSLIIKVTFIIFLWRDDIAGFFAVTQLVKKKTVLITAIITLLFNGILIFIL